MRHRIGESVELGVRRLKLRGVAAQLLVSPLAIRDVAQDRREGGPVARLPGGQRQVDWKLGAVLPPSRQLHRLPHHPSFPRGKIALQPGRMRGAEALGHQHRDRLPHDLRARIAKHPLRSGIDVHDVPVHIGGDDPVVGGDRQRAEALLARPQRRFRALPHRDVGRDHELRRPPPEGQHVRGDFDVDERPVALAVRVRFVIATALPV